MLSNKYDESYSPSDEPDSSYTQHIYDTVEMSIDDRYY